MHLGAAFVADEQPFELVEVGESAFDDPAHGAEARAVLGVAAGDQRSDPALTEEAAMLVVVVAAIGDQLLGAAARPTRTAGDGRDTVEERDQLGDVVAVAAGQRVGERDASRIDEEVVLRTFPASIDRARAGFGAPFFACTWLESTTVRAHSISPAARNRVKSSA